MKVALQNKEKATLLHTGPHRTSRKIFGAAAAHLVGMRGMACQAHSPFLLWIIALANSMSNQQSQRRRPHRSIIGRTISGTTIIYIYIYIYIHAGDYGMPQRRRETAAIHAMPLTQPLPPLSDKTTQDLLNNTQKQ
jgi:hypothetical protein